MEILLLTIVVGFVLTLVLGRFVLAELRRLKAGQEIRKEGPQWHAGKAGTPTMGGIMFIIGAVVAYTFCFVMMYLNGYVSFDTTGQLASFESISGMIMAVMFGFVGFVDDYIKVAKKRNEGLTEKQKLLLQLVASAAYVCVMAYTGNLDTAVRIPFTSIRLELGYAAYPIAVLILAGVVNGANFTDGIDGLASSVTFVIGGFFSFGGLMSACSAFFFLTTGHGRNAGGTNV